MSQTNPASYLLEFKNYSLTIDDTNGDGLINLTPDESGLVDTVAMERQKTGSPFDGASSSRAESINPVFQFNKLAKDNKPVLNGKSILALKSFSDFMNQAYNSAAECNEAGSKEALDKAREVVSLNGFEAGLEAYASNAKDPFNVEIDPSKFATQMIDRMDAHTDAIIRAKTSRGDKDCH